jgi:hypothetical protein
MYREREISRKVYRMYPVGSCSRPELGKSPVLPKLKVDSTRLDKVHVQVHLNSFGMDRSVILIW